MSLGFCLMALRPLLRHFVIASVCLEFLSSYAQIRMHTHTYTQNIQMGCVAIRNTEHFFIMTGQCNGKEKASVPIVSLAVFVCFLLAHAHLHRHRPTDTITNGNDHSIGKSRESLIAPVYDNKGWEYMKSHRSRLLLFLNVRSD